MPPKRGDDTAVRDAEMSRRRVQQEIIDGAHVICATLSDSGHEMFQGLNIEFETLVIDGAAQSIELSALILMELWEWHNDDALELWSRLWTGEEKGAAPIEGGCEWMEIRAQRNRYLYVCGCIIPYVMTTS